MALSARFDLTQDIAKAREFLSRLGQDRQFNFALSLALNKTTRIAAKDLTNEFPHRFDRPTPYTMHSVQVKTATKNNLVSMVGISEDFSKGTSPARYLAAEIGGGERDPKRSEMKLRMANILPSGWFTVPSKSAPLDSYGNIPGPIYSAILSDVGALLDQSSNSNVASRRERMRRGKSTYFAVKPDDPTTHLPPGIYERRAGSIRMILFFVRKAPHYSPRLPFEKIVTDSVRLNFGFELQKALERAIATAR